MSAPPIDQLSLNSKPSSNSDSPSNNATELSTPGMTKTQLKKAQKAAELAKKKEQRAKEIAERQKNSLGRDVRKFSGMVGAQRAGGAGADAVHHHLGHALAVADDDLAADRGGVLRRGFDLRHIDRLQHLVRLWTGGISAGVSAVPLSGVERAAVRPARRGDGNVVGGGAGRLFFAGRWRAVLDR